MKKIKHSLFLAGIVAVSLSLFSCDKELTEGSTDDTTTVADYTSILGILDLNEIDELIQDDNLKSLSESEFVPCFEVVINDNGSTDFWPRSWTFVYKDSLCADYFGNKKFGSVHVTLSDFWKNEGSTRTITFEDYSINGNKLEGKRTILNTGLNEAQNLTFDRSFEDASFTRGDTATMTWECAKEVEMIAGFETFMASDDEYLVKGGADGINYDGNTFELNIVEPLYYKKCSRFPVSGNVAIEFEGNPTIYINYGDGDCDDVAEMTIEGVTTEITL